MSFFEGLPFIENPDDFLASVQQDCARYLAQRGIAWGDVVYAYRVRVLDEGYVVFEDGPSLRTLEKGKRLGIVNDSAIRVALLCDEYRRHVPQSRAAEAVRGSMEDLWGRFIGGSEAADRLPKDEHHVVRGRARKPWIRPLIEGLTGLQNATPKELWKRIPKYGEGERRVQAEGGGWWRVYRHRARPDQLIAEPESGGKKDPLSKKHFLDSVKEMQGNKPR